MSKKILTSTYYFEINGMEYSAVADSKFAAKKAIKHRPNVPVDFPCNFIRSEPYVAKSVNPTKEEAA